MREYIVQYERKETDNPQDKCDLCNHAIVGELVRCKDCEYYEKGENEVDSWSQCTRAFGTFFNAQDDDFCSWAKMKGGAE